MAKKNNKIVLIIIGLALIAAAFLLFKNMMGQTVLVFPGQSVFSIHSWQHMPNGTQIAVGIVGAILLVLGIGKK